MDHRFSGTAFTVGIEEELMLVDPETLELAQGIESILGEEDGSGPGLVKPELMQAVLEIATDPCSDLTAAGEELRQLRRRVRESARRNGMDLAAAGTHPTGRGEEQLITARPRYQELAEELGWIARQELIFGTHVHIGIDGADKAIYVADAIRGHLPLMLAISSNSPLWRGEPTGMMSSRTPMFRTFPRVGIPPHYGTWEVFSSRVELMVQAGVVPDHTYLWWDVRPHPDFGTVEVRVFDQQTRLEDTLSLAALSLSLAHRYSESFESGEPLVEMPTELIDDNKVRAALHGLDGELIDLARRRHAPATELARELVEDLRPDARELSCEEALLGLHDLIDSGTGARRQLRFLDGGGEVPALVRHLCEEAAG